MTKLSSFLLSSIFLISFACSENKSSDENTNELQSQEIVSTIDTPATESSNEIASEETSQPVNEIIQQAAPNKPIQINTGEALNPAHGEPGHDCAIAVGAPLNSAKPAATSAPAQTSPVINPNPAPVPAPTSSPIMAVPSNTNPAGTSGKLNPAHGEPGHDCAKPVGSPL